ncbi:hypothetical protein JANAI62_01730 [Jannaschia pagri]|uniref:Rhodanese domain-containing protein n=1 Tax=Jannaschia pagri TaxID=2829797 RepID=A0ABQ4NGJ7_9RHOB|nr:hypothetical protein JANAI61_08020 [Jannaschia sp. AI_61]GIT93550.1 hypothetical protein JANAI62_01730 [Jannaschia sp. AI_62]
MAAGLLRTDGLDARTMRGGHLAWVAAGHPVCRVSLRKRRWVIPLDTNWAELASLWVLLRLLDRAAQVQAIERSWCAAAAEVWTASVLPATPGALAEAAGLEHPLVARLLGGPEELLAGRLARMSQPTAALDLIDDWIARPEGAA